MALNSVFLLTCETEAFCNFQNMNNFFARRSQVFFCLLLYHYCCIWNNSKPYYCPITKQIPRTCFHTPEHNTVKKPSSLKHLPSVSVSALAALLKILLPWSPELLPTHIQISIQMSLLKCVSLTPLPKMLPWVTLYWTTLFISIVQQFRTSHPKMCHFGM